jgi:hypothetical protein
MTRLSGVGGTHPYPQLCPAHRRRPGATNSPPSILADPGHAVPRDEIIGRCLALADHIARRYAGRGVEFDDLQQTARIGAPGTIADRIRSHPAPGSHRSRSTVAKHIR